MWCKHCRQDVKGVRSPEQLGANCARCGSLLFADEDSPRAEASGVARSAAHGIDLGQAPPIETESTFEDWELDERYRRVQARVGRWKHHEAQPPQAAAPSREPAWHIHQRHSAPPKRHARPSRAPERSPLAARMMIGLSLLATVSGAALLGSSVWLVRGELWSPGIATIVAGQIGLLAGLALRLEARLAKWPRCGSQAGTGRFAIASLRTDHHALVRQPRNGRAGVLRAHGRRCQSAGARGRS